MFGMNKIHSVSLLLILIQEVGHILSMSITDPGILKRMNLQTLSFGEALMLGLVLITVETETLSSGGIQKVTIKYLILTTRHTPLFTDVTPGLVFSILTKLGFSQELKHYLNQQ